MISHTSYSTSLLTSTAVIHNSTNMNKCQRNLKRKFSFLPSFNGDKIKRRNSSFSESIKEIQRHRRRRSGLFAHKNLQSDIECFNVSKWMSPVKEESQSPDNSYEDIKDHHERKRVSHRQGDKNDRIIINVGGTRHETFRSTLRLYPDTRLGWIAINGSESIDAYDPVRNEYFFDRHPTAFNHIINFYRTGKLHAPSDICGPLFEEELTYWGLEEKSMEPCCWSKYTEHRDAEENLKVFDNPVLNPQEEEKEITSKYDKILRNANNKKTFLKRISKAIKPSCFQTDRWLKFKKNTWIIFEDHGSINKKVTQKVVSMVSLTFILLSVLSLCFYSMLLHEHEIKKNTTSSSNENNDNNSIETTYVILLIVLDVLCCIWFTTEFALRFISAPNRTSFITEFMNVIDLLTIVPYFIHFAYTDANPITSYISDLPDEIKAISTLRLIRLFRFFRLSTGLQILKHTMIASSKELLLLLLLLTIPVAIFATIVYYCERKVTGTKFKTIPESIWWAIITMTTVGYGDMSPSTTQGKIFGAFCATCSVLILALPVSIIGNNFTLFYHYAQARMKLPKRPQNALVGAANALVAETSQHSVSPDEEDDDENSNKTSIDMTALNGGNICYSKRYRRERLSLYTSSPSRPSIIKRSNSDDVTNISNDLNSSMNVSITTSAEGKQIFGVQNDAFGSEEHGTEAPSENINLNVNNEEQSNRNIMPKIITTFPEKCDELKVDSDGLKPCNQPEIERSICSPPSPKFATQTQPAVVENQSPIKTYQRKPSGNHLLVPASPDSY